MKIINITNGDCFNKYISQRHAGYFVPFKEAMIEGNPLFPLFDDSFCQERTNTHMSSSALEYRKHMGDFLTVNFNEFDEIVGIIDLTHSTFSNDLWIDYAWIIWSFEYNINSKDYTNELLKALNIKFNQEKFDEIIKLD